ncbi:gluconate 2-dehydrogenase subunit 3 family protein [Celeribacter sp.]|uniref:gluconate 2-dehydrogenase subunit 3 family protein n=1 Tax=Celeribacter sp. TaxID=1890673 RepID=UPI003A8EA429
MSNLLGRPSRRGFLKGTAAGTAFAAIGTSVKAEQPLPPLEEYTPSYLTEAEYTFIMAACGRLIPSEGNGPGALETRVPVFIDLQLAGDFGAGADWYMEGPHDPSANPLLGYQTPLTPAEIYRKAIPLFQDWCQKTHAHTFENLDAQTQDAALTSLQNGDVGLPDDVRDFFSLLLQNTKEGYFADPMYGGNYGMQAWTFIGFPGARAAYTEWVPHFDHAYPLSAVSISGERA